MIDRLRQRRTAPRRLSDKILIAFDQACDEVAAIEMVSRLLAIVEGMIQHPSMSVEGCDRRSEQSLVAAYKRLWLLQRGEALPSAIVQHVRHVVMLAKVEVPRLGAIASIQLRRGLSIRERIIDQCGSRDTDKQ